MSLRISHTSLVLVLCSLVACSHGGNEEEPETGGPQGTGVAGTTTPPTGNAGSGTNNAGGGAAGRAASAGSSGSTGQTGTAGQVASAGSAAAGSGGTTASQAGSGGATAGSSGQTGTAGMTAGQAGMTGTAGSAAGSGGSKGNESLGDCKPWPKSSGDMPVTSTIRVTGSFDGMLKRFVGAGALGGGGQDEGQDPIFQLSNGATLENVILGAPAADGIHCEGACTLKNVWWEDVGEDAATLKGSSDSQVMLIDCGGARKASDKVFQHNGPGTMRITNFYAEDFGKLYRSCGNCKEQHERHVEMSGIDAIKGKVLAGINANYGDTAKFENIKVHDTSMKMEICDRFTGNSSGDEPSKIGSGSDGKSCVYKDSDIQWVQ